MRRRVGDFNEFGDEFWLLHESGAMLRRLIKRQNVDILLEAREVTLFPAPKSPIRRRATTRLVAKLFFRPL